MKLDSEVVKEAADEMFHRFNHTHDNESYNTGKILDAQYLILKKLEKLEMSKIKVDKFIFHNEIAETCLVKSCKAGAIAVVKDEDAIVWCKDGHITYTKAYPIGREPELLKYLGGE